MARQLSKKTQHHVDLSTQFGAQNYHPLDVVITKGQGEWLWDVDGKRYLDMLSTYSAVNQGHCHPRMHATLLKQAKRLTLSSRAFHNDQLGPWLKQITTLCGLDLALPMNSGAEAVETALKIARKWGYCTKGVPRPQAEIIVCANNFHGRTTTIVGFSSESQYRDDFGPYGPGFVMIPYGDVKALEKAITPHTVGFLVEPIQGEAGIIVPPAGYLAAASAVCKKNNVLLILDEIQTGLGRTGKMFAYQHEEDQVKPDLLVLGKALGGAYYPISAVVGRRDVVGLIKPGDHGSTFGGNPLACALSRTAMDILVSEDLAHQAAVLGEVLVQGLRRLPAHVVKEIRGKGLLVGLELHKSAGSGRFYSELLQKRGILAKETHEVTIRFAPPLVIKPESLAFALGIIADVFSKTQKEWESSEP